MQPTTATPPTELLESLQTAMTKWEGSWGKLLVECHPVTLEEAHTLFASGFVQTVDNKGRLCLSNFTNHTTGARAFKSLARHGITTWKVYWSSYSNEMCVLVDALTDMARMMKACED